LSSLKINETSLKAKIKAEAAHLGFVACGFSAARPTPAHRQYLSWLEDGNHAGMAYLARQDAVRARGDACQIFPDCKTVISLAFPYRGPQPPYPGPGEGRIAAYALRRDYHQHVRERANALADKMREWSRGALRAEIHIDTSPILEKAYAKQAGLGWIGRNSLLITPGFGSFVFLAEILVDFEFQPDPPFVKDPCAGCHRCVEACPTQAILPGRLIDARRCLSYLTIENRAEIPTEFKPALGNRIFGCDTCQSVCPFNRQNATVADLDLPQIDPNPKLRDCLNLTKTEFDQKYGSTPITRAKYSGFRRNAAVAAGNTNDPGFLPDLRQALLNEDCPSVRDALLWAVKTIEKQA
jgi:epoxyqueuosine reductase